MIANISMAPLVSSQLQNLDYIVGLLQQVNMQWIHDNMNRGTKPPCCPACAEPPWTKPGGVRYTEWHGISARGNTRSYLDGPTMFHLGWGTCADLAAYAAAAQCIIFQKDARTRVYATGVPGGFHAVCDVYDNRGALVKTVDPSAEIIARDAPVPRDVGGGCECG